MDSQKISHHRVSLIAFFSGALKAVRTNTVLSHFGDGVWNNFLRCGKDKTLDLDSTTLQHEDAHGKEGVRTGHTPRGFKRCYHPLLGMLAEVKLVLGF